MIGEGHKTLSRYHSASRMILRAPPTAAPPFSPPSQRIKDDLARSTQWNFKGGGGLKEPATTSRGGVLSSLSTSNHGGGSFASSPSKVATMP